MNIVTFTEMEKLLLIFYLLCLENTRNKEKPKIFFLNGFILNQDTIIWK